MSPLLTGLVDDAGLFPPTALPMAEALARHRATSSPVLSGRFLVPASRTPELLGLLAPGEGLRVHVVVDDPSVPLPDDPRLEVLALEVRGLPAGLPAGPHDVPVYVEGVAPADLAGTGLRGKVRCGGTTTPTVAELGAWVRAAVAAELPFKATAGLHRAVRGDEVTDGVAHHGYLNLLLAVWRALSGGDVEAVLASTDRAALVDEARTASQSGPADRVRALLPSYGSCDLELPALDAKGLAL